MKPFLPICLFLLFLQAPFGSDAQVTKLSNNSNLEALIPLPGVAILISEADSLWRSDGTAAGTFRYALNVAVDSTHQGAVFQNRYFFSGIDASGEELWVTDGTAGGTSMVKNIKAGAGSSSPKHYIEFDNALYFFADDGTHGTELWKSDGTGGGTALLKDINPGAGNSVDEGSLFSYFFFGGKLYFTASNGSTGTELWMTDGTPGGTQMVKDINAGANGSFPHWFHQYGSVVLFVVNTGATTGFFRNYELWKTDGTAAGTVQVKSFGTSFLGLGPSGFKTFNNKVFFNAFTSALGIEGWVTDGTPANTVLLKDIHSGSGNGYPIFLNSIVHNNRMIFSASTSGTGREMWTTDGTEANTTLFKDIATGSRSSNPWFIPYYSGGNPMSSGFFKGLVFMTATTQGAGTELWKTDGTPGGTTIIKDIYPGVDSSMNTDDHFSTFFFTTDHLYFSATDGTTGYELWKSDGTEAGTTLVKDINEGGGHSDPQFIGVFNGIYFFTAHDGDNPDGKRDLFRLNGTFMPIPLPLHLLHFSGNLTGKTATLNWTTAGEKNTDHFVVERSVNGSQFAPAGQVPAQKAGADRKYYQFQDADALSGSGSKVYYRLKMVDNDGKFTYSKIITFTRTPEARMLIYPNPVREELRLTVETGSRKQLSLRVFDEGGKQVYQQKLNGAAGSNSYGINVSQLAKGSYILNVVTDDGVETSRFIKQ